MTTLEKLAGALHPGDVLLVEGNNRISVVIKYLTQASTVLSEISLANRVKRGPDGPFRSIGDARPVQPDPIISAALDGGTARRFSSP